MRPVERGLLVCAAFALAMLPGPAGAERRTDHDPAGDMWSTPVGTTAYAPVPHHVQGDIVAVRVIHAPRAVWIRVRFRELTATTNGNFHRIAITSDRRSRFVEIDALPGHWEGTVQTTGLGGRSRPCAVGHHIDYDRGRLVVKVPRQCLGKPSWVRVGVRSTVAGTVRVYTDDAHSRGVPATIALGRRVRH